MPALFYPSELLPTLFYEIRNFVLRNCGLFACRHILYCGGTIGYFAFANDDDKRNVVEMMDNLKELLYMNPSEFYPIISERLRKCGISYVLVPYLNKSYIYGATKWFSNDNVMLAMSNRTGRADMFWFTLFHELSHVLKEHKRYCLLQADNIDDEEADDLASKILIPKDEWNEFIKNSKYLNNIKVRSFAESIDVPPFIVVGRLARENKIKYTDPIYKQNMISYKNEDFIKIIN